MSQTYTIGGLTNGGYITNGITASSISADTTWSTTASVLDHSGRMELKGNQADLVINGVSLTDTLKAIQDRLCMLRPNAALEAEWDQLQELGQQYRKLEAELLEKQRAWDILRKTHG
jgi:hypothetical protein